MSKLDDIKGALASYGETLALFDEASEEGEPLAKDYEYRDDDAVLFASTASAFIELVLPHIDALAAARQSRGPGDDPTNRVFKAVGALLAAVNASQGGTEEGKTDAT